MVLGQSESEYCIQILALASDQVELCIPVFSLYEPHFTLRQRSNIRERLAREITAEAKQLERSEHYRVGPYTPIRDIGSDFLKMSEHFDETYEHVLADLRGVSRLISLDASTINFARGLQESRPFARMDAVILSSILSDLSGSPTLDSCFVTVDESFAVACAALPELQRQNCVVKSRFHDALQYITHPRS